MSFEESFSQLRAAARATLDAAQSYDEVRAAAFVLGQVVATERLLADGGFTPYTPLVAEAVSVG